MQRRSSTKGESSNEPNRRGSAAVGKLQTAVRSLQPSELFALTAENERLLKLEQELTEREAALRLREAELRAAHESECATRVAAAVAEATARVLAEAARRQEDAVSVRDRFWQAQIEVELKQCATMEREASGQIMTERAAGDVAARQTIQQASVALSEARQLIQTWR